jgi:hypothetical protein
MGKHVYSPIVLVCTLSTSIEGNQRTRQDSAQQKLLPVPGIR